jgi:hypothetical protein
MEDWIVDLHGNVLNLRFIKKIYASCQQGSSSYVLAEDETNYYELAKFTTVSESKEWIKNRFVKNR